MAAKDMYADLEKIEARGKRKKEKSKGFFSTFGNKDEPELDDTKSSESGQTTKPTPEPAAPAKEPMFSKREEPRPIPTTTEPAVPKTEPVAHAPPAVKPQVVHHAETQKPAPRPPEPEPESSWKPLNGGRLKKAEEDLLIYKKWLNRGYKSGVLTKEQCVEMVRAKEIELGLKPPE